MLTTVVGKSLSTDQDYLPIDAMNPTNNANTSKPFSGFEFSSHHLNLKGSETVVRQAYRVSDVMLELSYKPADEMRGYVALKGANRVISAYLETTKIKSSSSRFKPFRLTDLEVSFIDNIGLSSSGLAYKTRLDANSLAKSYSDKNLSNLIDYSINENLSVAKQSRWLLRNLPVSECLSNSNFTYTQAKSLIGNPVYNSTISSKNIWASSNINNMATRISTNPTNFLSTHSGNLSSLINYFEDSRSFLNKKAYFTLQPRFNSTTLSTSINNLTNATSTKHSFADMQEVLLLDANLLLLGNTLSSGNSMYDNTNVNQSQGSLFVSSDYLNYFTSSHDSFVISLNTTNTTCNDSFKFFSSQELGKSFDYKVNL